jgi:hypothetical protein
MNILSAKLWLRALVDLLPDVVINAGWIPYAEVMAERDRGIRDALVMLDPCDGVVATGGDFTFGMHLEWKRAVQNKQALIDLASPPMPGLLTYETFAETQTASFRSAVVQAFMATGVKKAA